MAKNIAHPILGSLKLLGKITVDYEFHEGKTDDGGPSYEIRYFNDKKAAKARLDNPISLNGRRIIISVHGSDDINTDHKELDALIPLEDF